MVCVPASEILVGCLLLLIFSQGSCSRTKPLSRESCTIRDCMVNITCIVINKEYVDCNWTRSKKQDMSYNFSSAFQNEDSYQECPQYRQQHGQNVGCRIPLPSNDTFISFSTTLSIGRNQSVSKKYDKLTKIVKLNPPYNLSAVWTANSGLCLHWVTSHIKITCLNYSVRYQRGFDQWEVHLAKKSPYCVPFVSKSNFTFQVRNKIGITCGESDIWSDWSDPVRWGNYTEDITAPQPQPQSWWQLWVPVLGVIVLIGLAVLLFYCERIKVLLVVPDPSKNLQDLFQKHNGNVESWVYISRELKDAFEPDYTESPCVVCEPSPTLKAKGYDEPVQQPSS